MLWNKDSVSISSQVTSPYAIHAIVSLVSKPKPWMLSAVYASPRRSERSPTWDQISRLGEHANYPYAAVGDFNTIISTNHKQGGNPPSAAQLLELNQVM